MRKWLIAIIGAIAFAPSAWAAFAIFQTYLPAGLPAAVTSCDITTGNCTGLDAGTGLFTAATCNGVADAAPAFRSFNAWARTTTTNTTGQLLELVVPNGSNCLFDTGNVNNNQVLSGLKKSRLMGYGATFTHHTPGGSGWNLGPAPAGGGQCQAGITFGNGCSARISTVSAGASSVTVDATASGVSLATLCGRFTAGLWAMVSGFDMQRAGFPTNPHFFEYVQISSTANCTTTGQITFNTTLVNSYLSTWPLYNAGTAVEADQGGPATIYQLGQYWGGESSIYGLTIDGTFATKALGRSVLFQDNTVTGSICLWPSENGTITYTNLVASNCNIEVDKLATNIVFNNLQIRKIHVQSSSVDNFIISGGTFTETSTCAIDGTPKNAIFSNIVTLCLKLGPQGYGTAVSASCTNCSIGNVLSSFGNVVDRALACGGVCIIGANNVYTVSGGVFSIPWSLPVSGFADNGSGFARLTLPTTSGLSAGYVIGNSGILTGTGCSGGCPTTVTISSVIDATHVDTTLVFANFTWTGGGSLYSDPPWWAAPGTNVSASGISSVAAGVPFFQVTGVTQNSTHTLIATTLGGGYPNVPLSSGKSNLVPTGLRWTCTNCTGTAQAVDFSGLPANIPLFSRTKRSYTNSTALENGSLWGKVTSITINVTQAYTGSTSPMRFNFSEQGVTSAGVFTQWIPSINLRQAGIRTITPAGVTCDTGGGPVGGACSGDTGLTLADPAQMFSASLGLSKPDGSPTDQPWAMNYEFIMDQGVVP